MTDYSSVGIRVEAVPDRVALVRRLRTLLDAPVAALNDAIVSGGLIPLCRLHGPDHGEVEVRLVALLTALDSMGIKYTIVLGAEQVTRIYLSNMLSRHREI